MVAQVAFHADHAAALQVTEEEAARFVVHARNGVCLQDAYSWPLSTVLAELAKPPPLPTKPVQPGSPVARLFPQAVASGSNSKQAFGGDSGKRDTGAAVPSIHDI